MGFLISFMPACFGVWLPFLTLQAGQAQTMFSQVALPPWLRGIMWSSDNSLVGKRLPQYWQWFLSRAKMFRRLNIVSIRLEITLELANIAPAIEIVVGISTLFE